VKLYSAEGMREADQRAQALGYPALLLMEAAGRAVAEAVHREIPEGELVVLAGRGNNGGDGLAAARWLHLWGRRVKVYAASGQRDEALLMRRALELSGIEVEPLERWQPGGAAVIDALFGTGLNRPLDGVYAEVIRRIQEARLPVIAVDLPSGLPLTPHLEAQLTVALGGLKREHLFYPARAACGRIQLAEIGVPLQALAGLALADILEPQEAQALFPRRSGDAHKGSVGRVLIVGGHPRYTGAPALAAWAAYRAGAGLVTVAYPEEAQLSLPMEAVRLPFRRIDQQLLQEAKAEAQAVGMGLGPIGPDVARVALRGLPTVLDADALHPDVVRAYREAGIPTLITPHPGEARRLLGELPDDPLKAAEALAQTFGVTVILKGGPSVIAEPGRLAVNPSGNPAMASGGMGDVLSGILAALLAAGLSPWDAARLGVYWHGLAGDRLSVGLFAHEVAEELPKVREELLRGGYRPFGWTGPS
jgi:hydroxyethylthiazole kinase-like uncharacterized protein yjeF